MNRFAFLCLLGLIVCTGLSAQKNEGVIVFEEKINMHRNLPPDANDMRAMIPEFRTAKSEFLFKGSESLYHNAEEEDESENEAPGGGQMRIVMQRPEATYYRNFAENKRVDARDFLGKRYLIEDTLSKLPWKVTTEMREIQGFLCMRATWSDTTNKRDITAWFTNDIAISAGPTSYMGLPGMILAVDVNNGEQMVTAQKIEFKTVDKKVLEAPKKGEKISAAAFDKLVADFRKQNGGRPGIRITRN